MTVGTLECGTLDSVPKQPDPERDHHAAEVVAALKARKAAEKVVERRRDELAEKIAAAYATGKFKGAELARLSEYTPEHVRRILRAHGIEGDSSRLTPTQRLGQQIRSRQARPNDPPFPPAGDE